MIFCATWMRRPKHCGTFSCGNKRQRAYAGSYMALLLINSLVTAGMATLLATLFGLATGLVTAALPGMLRRLALVAALVALAMPPFLVANCWLYYLGNVG